MPARATRARLRPTPVSGSLRLPRFQQVYVALRGWIADGTLKAGAQLPTEPELCAAFEVSRITVRRAVDDLVSEGFVSRRQGRGTFVEKELGGRPLTMDLNEVSLQVANLGRTTAVADLRVQWVSPDEATRSALALPADARVHRSRRVRMRDGERLGIVTAWVTEDVGRLLRKTDLRQRTVLELIEQAGVGIESAEQTIGATLAGIDTARALDIAVGTPLICIDRVVMSTGGRPVERVEALWRADAYQWRMRMKRSREGSLSGWMAD